MRVDENTENVRRGSSARRLAAVVAFLVVGALVVHFEALTVGYVLATLLLSAFFVAVAFDIGVPKGRSENVARAGDEAEVASEAAEPTALGPPAVADVGPDRASGEAA